MDPSQVSINFNNPKRHDDGKKNSRIPTAVSEDLKTFVDLMAKIQHMSVSELTHRYIVDGLKNDIVKMFMNEPHMDKSLREILSKFK